MLELKLGKLRIFLSLIRKRFSLVAVAQGTQAVKTVHINMNCKDGTEQAVERKSSDDGRNSVFHFSYVALIADSADSLTKFAAKESNISI